MASYECNSNFNNLKTTINCTQIKDVVVVWTLLGVFLLAWAISSQALLFIEESKPNLDTIGAMLMRSYWPMFGQYNFGEWNTSMHPKIKWTIVCFYKLIVMIL